MDYALQLLIQSRYDRDRESRTLIGLSTIPQEVPTSLADWKGHHVTCEVRYPIELNGGDWVLGHMIVTDAFIEGKSQGRREEIGLKLSTASLRTINESVTNVRLPLEYSVRG